MPLRYTRLTLFDVFRSPFCADGLGILLLGDCVTDAKVVDYYSVASHRDVVKADVGLTEAKKLVEAENVTGLKG